MSRKWIFSGNLEGKKMIKKRTFALDASGLDMNSSGTDLN